MKNILFLFLFLIPVFLFAQYPTGTNKSRLGYQTTGDGLIWRGVAADTAIKPRTNANAYFQLDTVNRVLRLYIATQGSWQVVGATPDLSAYLLKSDTAAMLVKYIERGDTATMLAKYIERGDTAAMLANYPTFGDVATSLGNYLPIIGGTLTGTGGAGFIGFPSQVVAPGTPASGLNVYAQGSSFNWKGTDGYERQFASTLTGGRTYTLPDVSGTFALGTGTADRSARWGATNTLAAGNFTDNGTKLQALLPFQLQQWTTGGRPTGVTGYTGYNTTGNGMEWYQGSRWAYGLESTFARGTSTYVPHFNANGQISEDDGFRYDASNDNLGIGGAPSAALHIQGNKSAASWTGSGIGLRVSPATYTNTTSSGTVAEIAAHSILVPTFAASSPTTYTRSANLRLSVPVSGANVTQTEPFALLAENAYIGRLVTEYGSSVFLGSQISQTLTKANTAHYTISRAGGASAALYGQATANGSSAYGVVGDALGNSGSANLLTGVYGEATNVHEGTANGSSAIGLSARVNSAKNDTTSHIIGVQSYVNLTFQGGTGTKINTATAFYGFPITRNNHSAKEINGFYFPGLAMPLSSPIPVSNVYRPLRILQGNTTNVLRTWSLIDHKTTIGSQNESSQELDVYGDFLSRDTIFNTNPATHTTVDGFATWKSTAQGYALGRATFGSGLSFSGGVLSATWLKPQLEAGSVTINAASNTLNLKQGRINAKNSSAATTAAFGDGFLLLSKGTVSNWGGSVIFRDTIDRDNYFTFQQDDRGVIQNIGTGRQLTLFADNTSLPGQYRWAFGVRVDTSTNISTLRIMLGDRYAGATIPVMLSANAGVGNNESVNNAGVQVTVEGASGKKAFGVNNLINARIGGKVYFAIDSTFSFDPANDLLQLSQMGAGTKEAADLSKTQSNYIASFATDGTVLDLERKRDTTIYITDADLDFSAAITTAQIASRFNRVIFLITTTAAAGSNSELTLHTPDANLLQVEYLIRSTDETGGFTNVIQFGSNNAVASDNSLVSSYTPAAGQGVGIRAGLRSGVYKYFYY